MKGTFEDTKLKSRNISFENRQLRFFGTLENASKYVRWLMDNDKEGYQKFLKEENDKS